MRVCPFLKKMAVPEWGAAFNFASSNLAANQGSTGPVYDGKANLSTVFFLFGLHALIPR
jgi:hypothetical protein